MSTPMAGAAAAAEAATRSPPAMEREPHAPALEGGIERRSDARLLPWLFPWALAIAGTLLTLALTR